MEKTDEITCMIGIVDTQVLVQDSANDRLLQSLSNLALHYVLYPSIVIPAKEKPSKLKRSIPSPHHGGSVIRWQIINWSRVWPLGSTFDANSNNDLYTNTYTASLEESKRDSKTS